MDLRIFVNRLRDTCIFMTAIKSMYFDPIKGCIAAPIQPPKYMALKSEKAGIQAIIVQKYSNQADMEILYDMCRRMDKPYLAQCYISVRTLNAILARQCEDNYIVSRKRIRITIELGADRCDWCKGHDHIVQFNAMKAHLILFVAGCDVGRLILGILGRLIGSASKK